MPPRFILYITLLLALATHLFAVSAFYKSSSWSSSSSLRNNNPAKKKTPNMILPDTPPHLDGNKVNAAPRDYSHLLIDGWFHERNDELWPGQALSLEVKRVLYH